MLDKLLHTIETLNTIKTKETKLTQSALPAMTRALRVVQGYCENLEDQHQATTLLTFIEAALESTIDKETLEQYFNK